MIADSGIDITVCFGSGATKEWGTGEAEQNKHALWVLSASGKTPSE